MRLHLHLPTAFVGGGERHVEYLIQAWADVPAASAPTILLTYEHAAIAPFVLRLGVSSERVTSAEGLAAAIADFGADVVQFYTSALVYAALGMLWHRPRVVEVVHNVARFPGDAFSYPKDRTDLLVCVSHHARLFAWAHGRDRPGVVIPNGIDLERFAPHPELRAPQPVIGFMGRLSAEKGIDTLFEIASQLPCPLEIVGHDFEDYASRVPRNVRILPETDDPASYYRRWWAFVSASPLEAFGMAIVEAMACGCPPVVVNCGGVVAYLRNGIDALITDDAKALPELVRSVVDGRVALRPQAQAFSAQAMAGRYLNAYRIAHQEIAPPAVPRAVNVNVFKPVRGRPQRGRRILGVAPFGWYGVVRALAGICDHFADTGLAIAAIDRLRPRLVVLGCFQDDWLPICRHARSHGIPVVATWHASYILNEFHAVNRTWMAQMLDAYRAGQIDYLATPHRGLAENWTHFGYATAWLPNIVDIDLAPQRKLPGIHIGLFGSGLNWKNMECQIAAAGMIPGAVIHTHPLQATEVIDRLGIRCEQIRTPLNDAQYLQLLGSMTVNLCVSQSEVYSYLTAESFLMETPVLTGSITPLIRDEQGVKPWLSLCHTPHFDDPVAIRDQLLRLIDQRAVLGPRLRQHMIELNTTYRAQCERVLSRWIHVDATNPASKLDDHAATVLPPGR